MTEKKSYPLSISSYALIFLLIVAASFFAIGTYTFYKIDKARQAIHSSDFRTASEEVEQAVNLLMKTVSGVSERISSWDEIFQQLENPSYYSYWREHRLLQSEVLPDYIESAEVFNDQGIALATLSESHFPTRIDTGKLTPLITLEAHTSEIKVYLPVKRNLPNAQVKGYIGLEFPFIQTLIDQYRFRLLDADTLSIQISGKQSLTLDEGLTQISFQLKPNQEAETMMKIVKTSIIQVTTVIAALCIFFYFLMVYMFAKPLLEITRYINQLRYSNPGKLPRKLHLMFPVAELKTIKTSLNQYHTDLEKTQQELDGKNKELWELAHHDALTGMFNRRAFELEWAKSKNFLTNHRVGVCLLLFDVNHFKAINDSYGHKVGDEVLIAISSCIQNALRKAEYLYRIGGDEFAAIILGSTPEQEIEVANRCSSLIKNYDFSTLGIKEAVSISCGISHCQADDPEKLDKLQWQADIAVYQAKRPGNTRPVLFISDMADGTEAVFSNWMSNAVYEAVAHGTGIEIHYQPIVDTYSRNIKYYEALLRIRHEKELIPPSHIFPVVTMRHMEMEMDRAIIAKVLDDISARSIPDNRGVSINLSAESVAHQELLDWIIPLSDYTKSYTIIIEVTETSLITQLSTAVDNLKMLRKFGFKVALDDFGSGYSSLRYLTSMPVDIVKFDISLIQGMMDERLSKMVGEMASMLTGLGYKLVAEGIENEELLNKVEKAGFEYSQGYLFGGPARLTEKN